MIECVKNWNIDDIDKIISQSTKNKILSALNEENIINLSNLKNVWCATITINNELMLLNIVATNEKT